MAPPGAHPRGARNRRAAVGFRRLRDRRRRRRQRRAEAQAGKVARPRPRLTDPPAELAARRAIAFLTRTHSDASSSFTSETTAAARRASARRDALAGARRSG